MSWSLNPDSRSCVLAELAVRTLKEAGESVELLDLREADWPICDGKTCYQVPCVAQAIERIRVADAVLMATPIYNFNVSAAAKNFVELTGRAWQDKVVGFLCAAGGRASYMSVMSLANSLMLDFRCLILPRFVYVTGEAFDEHSLELTDAKVLQRLKELTEMLVRVATCLRKPFES